jgi:hypothetical protein
MKGLGQHIYWVLLLVTWGLGQHTLLGIAVGLCGASGNTPILRVLLVYVAPRDTHFTLYCCSFMQVIVAGYFVPRATHFTGYCWFMRPRPTHLTG